MTSATERIRAMLDERGVEWEARDYFEQTTQWSTHNGAFVYWARERDGKLLVETTAPTKCSASCTPEQAIAATLGSCNCSSNCMNGERTETCYDTGESRIFHCSECGLGLDDVYIDDEQHYSFADFPRFCPWCGAKVVCE